MHSLLYNGAMNWTWFMIHLFKSVTKKMPADDFTAGKFETELVLLGIIAIVKT